MDACHICEAKCEKIRAKHGFSTVGKFHGGNLPTTLLNRIKIMQDTFLTVYRGLLEGVLSDTQYKSLCNSVNGSWYAIDVSSEEKLLQNFSADDLSKHMLNLLNIIQKRNMVSANYPYTYAKNISDPILIKVYDPMSCGSSCSTNSPDPWWIFSKIKPEENELKEIFPRNTRKFFGLLKV